MLRPHLGAIIPCGITALRIVAAGLLLYALSEGMRPWALTLFLFSCVTDYIDGYLARRLGVCTVLGSYLDATADFLVVLASFTAFVRQGVYPWWTVLVIVSMFLQFIVTSKLGRPIYDPVGKYYGTFLFAAIGVTLLWPHSIIRHAIPWCILGLTAASVTSRVVFLVRSRRKANRSHRLRSETDGRGRIRDGEAGAGCGRQAGTVSARLDHEAQR